jgi:hypothetical protein
MADLTEGYSKIPTDWFADWAYDTETQVISVPRGSFPEMSVAEANAASGDIANILYAIAHRAYAAFNSIPLASRPANWVMYKTETPVAGADDQSRVSFTLSFLTSVPAGQRNVVPEA